jgi:hypothetical protein
LVTGASLLPSPTLATMSRRASSSTHMRRPWLPDRLGEYPLGRHTGLSLTMCEECGLQRVLELMAQIDDNGNKGRVFFKCPRNMQEVSHILCVLDLLGFQDMDLSQQICLQLFRF